MVLSLYNTMVNHLTQSVTALNSFYASLHTNIQHAADRYLFEQADEWTGNRLTRSYIESFLEENRQYLGNSYQGLAVVQTAQQQSSRIYEKLEQMESLAQNAAGGLYSEEEIEDFQAEFETLMGEIDQIAIGTRPGGFAMLAFTAFGAVGVAVDRDQKVEIDSMDMTITGLGIINSIDLAHAPDESLAAVQAAMEEVSAYRGHLDEVKNTLEEALDILNDERETLQPALALVSEKQSAWRALEAVMGTTYNTTASLLAIQAHVNSDKAIQLLLEELNESE